MQAGGASCPLCCFNACVAPMVQRGPKSCKALRGHTRNTGPPCGPSGKGEPQHLTPFPECTPVRSRSTGLPPLTFRRSNREGCTRPPPQQDPNVTRQSGRGKGRRKKSLLCGTVLKVKFLGATYTDESNHFYNYTLITYEVELLKVLKNDNDIQNLKQIYTSTEYACEIFINPGDYNREYLVIGFYRDGRLELIYCDYVVRWSELSASQIKGIEGAYIKGCDCNILNCETWQCNTATIDDCTLKEDYQYYDQDYPEEVTSPAPEEDNTPQVDKMCARNENGICTWQSVE